LGAGVVAGSVKEVIVGSRQVTIRVDAAERLKATLELTRKGERVAKAKQNIAVGGGKVRAEVPKALNGGPTTVSFELTPRPEGTLLRFTHSNLPTTESVASHTHGWEHYLERLRAAGSGEPLGEDPWIANPPHA